MHASARLLGESDMTVTAVIDSITQVIGDIASGIRAFVSSDQFRKFLQRIAAWFESALLWFVNAIIGLAAAIIRFVKSDSFQDGAGRVRKLVIRGCQWGLRAIKWIGRWLHQIASSEAVETGVATTSDLLELCLPKASQRISVAIAIFVVAMVLIFSWPESDPGETVSVPGETVPTVTPIAAEMPDFAEIPAGVERKAAFFGYFLPIVESQNRLILATRENLENWYANQDDISPGDAAKIDEIAVRYRIEDFDIESDESWNKLFHRVDAVPPSLALAQSANESAWGTSRFAREGNNFYGQWCFRKGCGLVPKKRDANKTHEVAAFDSPQESVRVYIRNLNSNSAYKGLRDIRADLRKANKSVTGQALAAGLKRYSERGMEYVKELREMIAGNKLAVYDTF